MSGKHASLRARWERPYRELEELASVKPSAIDRANDAGYQRGIAAAVEALTWLASARREYCHLKHDERGVADIHEYWEASEMIRALHSEHQTAEGLARILSAQDDGAGWLPSWRWDDWREFAEKLHLPILQIDID